MHKLLKILVVDDDEIDRIAVHRGLQKAGLKIELSEASSYAEALVMLTDGVTALRKNYFDCVFLDYRLPDRDGLALIQELQNRDISVPVVVLTGQGDEQIAVQLMKAGASDYLPKSKISPEILETILRNAIRVHQAEKKVELTQQRLRVNNKILKRQNQELARQRQQIELQNLKLQELSRLKSQFLANMSHELRTPMNSIMGFSQLLLRQYPDPLTPQQIDIVNRIFNNSQNLLMMLNEVLDFSKIEAGQLEINLSEFDLSRLVTLTVEELRSLALNKKLSLQIDNNLENPYVYSDRNFVKRILINLVSNAIKFTDIGEVEVLVRELTAEKLQIVIKDTGCGIPQKNLREIFEAFRQVDQSITRRYTGTGLGLAITDSLVKMLQGTITVESELGQGSEFRIELPRRIQNT
jgi:signal transduction histidine kinase